MGNIFEATTKSATNAKTKLNRSLIHCDLIEKILYLENKLDMLDNKLFVLEGNTQANIKVISSDVHQLHQRLIDLKK
tara:strand:- start:50 stop:280 length:231 start_codon:yes stop_codon:yes gene_type:complete